MPCKKGDYLGGIRTVECLRLRSWVDKDTGCWHWRLAIWDGSPRVHLREFGHKAVRGRRAALMLYFGRDLAPGMLAIPKPCCNSSDCVNPAHSFEGTRADHEDYMRRTGKHRTPRKVAVARSLVLKKKRIKLSFEKAAAIRASNESTADLARRYGIAMSAITAVRTGKAWRDFHTPAVPA